REDLMTSRVAEAPTQQTVAYRGLRGWLDEVSRMGELLHVNGADWDVEMRAITHMLTEKSSGTAPAMLFDDIPGYAKGFRTLYGHFSSIRRVALTLGLPLKHERKFDIVQRYHDRMADLKPLRPRFVQDGPLRQREHQRAAGELLRLPAPRRRQPPASAGGLARPCAPPAAL